MLEAFLKQAEESTAEAPPVKKVRFTGASALNGVLRLDAVHIQRDEEGNEISQTNPILFHWEEDIVNPSNVPAILAHFHMLINERKEVKEHEGLRGVAVAKTKYDLSRLRIFPYAHQVVGIEALIAKAWFALFDEMGAGKTKQSIDALMILYTFNIIDRVLVIAPGDVKFVWYDSDLGELASHLWHDVPVCVKLFHSKVKEWRHGPWPAKNYLTIICTNYEFIRSKNRLAQISPFCNEKTLLICDEAWAIKNDKAVQTKATMQLRNRSGRVILLNGTPVANSPMDLYAQGRIMSPAILGCKTSFEYRSRYAIMGGWQQKEIKGWRDVEDIQNRFAPYVLRRLKKDCLDLPDKLEPVLHPYALTPETWKIYTSMRDDLVVWFGNNVVTGQQAIVKVMRLAQICSGFIGGVEDSGLEVQQDLHEERPSWVPALPDFGVNDAAPAEAGKVIEPIREIGREGLDSILAWYEERLAEKPTFKCILNFRFRPELARFEKEFTAKYPHIPFGLLQGGQSKDRYKAIDGEMVLIQRGERNDALRLLHPRSADKSKPAMLAAIENTGKAGYNLAAAEHVGYGSHDPSLFVRKQSEDRAHRPGQIHSVGYTDWVATGPDGQKTVMHHVLNGLRKKEEIANYTTSAWVRKLNEE